MNGFFGWTTFSVEGPRSCPEVTCRGSSREKIYCAADKLSYSCFVPVPGRHDRPSSLCKSAAAASGLVDCSCVLEQARIVVRNGRFTRPCASDVHPASPHVYQRARRLACMFGSRLFGPAVKQNHQFCSTAALRVIRWRPDILPVYGFTDSP